MESAGSDCIMLLAFSQLFINSAALASRKALTVSFEISSDCESKARLKDSMELVVFSSRDSSDFSIFDKSLFICFSEDSFSSHLTGHACILFDC